MPKIVLISRRVGGMSLTEYLNEQNGHSVVRTPASFWRRRKRAEFGGQPPRPVLSVASDFSAIGTLAAAFITQRMTGHPPEVTVPRDMRPCDVLEAVRRAGCWLDDEPVVNFLRQHPVIRPDRNRDEPLEDA
jgi:hypothetical protein